MTGRPEPGSAGSASRERGLGALELIAIGVGGMIGGGIFSVLGLAVQISGHGAWIAFLLGGLVALGAGYSYCRLALAFPVDGASFTYLERAFPRRRGIAVVTGWTVIVGYVGTLALYAFTFGAYGAALLAGPTSPLLLRHLLSAGVLVFFVIVNLRGVRASEVSEDLIVYAKVVILAIFAIAGFANFDGARILPVFDHGLASVFVAGATVFVAYEGFQLINSAVEETRRPQRDVPIGIYGAIAIVTTIYVLLALTSLGTLGADGLIAAREYALAEAARPVLGRAGEVLVALAALLATSSAINATIFGAARLMAQMAEEGMMPTALRHRSHRGVPDRAVVLLAVAGGVLAITGGLDLITSFSSLTFLLVSAAVAVANGRLKRTTGARIGIVAASLLLMATTITLVIVHMLRNEPAALAAILALYGVTAAAALGYFRHGRKAGKEAEP